MVPDALDRLRVEIIDRELRIDSLRRTVAQRMIETARLAIEQGHALIQVKNLLPHGAFRGWLTKHFPKTAATANEYMRAAQQSEDSDLRTDPQFQYEVLQAVGLVIERPMTRTNGRARVIIAPLYRALNMVTEFSHRERKAIEAWAPQRIADLETRLRPLVNFHSYLANLCARDPSESTLTCSSADSIETSARNSRVSAGALIRA